MRPSIALNQHRALIRQVVEANNARNARVFGSTLRGEDTENSDLDILVEPDERMTLMNIGAIRHELSVRLGVNVDVLTPDSLPPKAREQILLSAAPI